MRDVELRMKRKELRMKEQRMKELRTTTKELRMKVHNRHGFEPRVSRTERLDGLEQHDQNRFQQHDLSCSQEVHSCFEVGRTKKKFHRHVLVKESFFL